MSNTFRHAPWFVTDERIAKRMGREDWQSTKRGESAWHADAAPSFNPDRNYVTRYARRTDRAHVRQIIRAERWDDLTTCASMAGETVNARKSVYISRDW